jgi:hypothetical protein
MALEVRGHDGRIEIEPHPLPVTLRQKGRLFVAIHETEIEPLRAEQVEDTRESLDHERAPGT